MIFFGKKCDGFIFLLHLRLIKIEAIEYMRKVVKYVVAIAVVAVITLISTGCMRQDYMMFEDGEFDGVEFSDYDFMQNAELEMDDIDRN